MEDLSKYTNLQRRDGRYYFRVRVPLDLITALGKKEIKKSLRTSELSVAKSRLRWEQIEADQLFHATRSALAKSAPNKLSTDSPTRDEIERRVVLWFHEEAQRQAKQDDAERIGISEIERHQVLESLHSEQVALDTGIESTYQHIIAPVLTKLFGADSPQSVRQIASPPNPSRAD